MWVQYLQWALYVQSMRDLREVLSKQTPTSFSSTPNFSHIAWLLVVFPVQAPPQPAQQSDFSLMCLMLANLSEGPPLCQALCQSIYPTIFS